MRESHSASATSVSGSPSECRARWRCWHNLLPGRLGDRRGRRLLIVAGSLVMAIVGLLLPETRPVTVFAVGQALAFPSLMTLAAAAASLAGLLVLTRMPGPVRAYAAEAS